MPAVVNKVVASFSGIKDALFIIACHFDLKKSRYFWRNSAAVIFIKINLKLIILCFKKIF
jgi:hypothetical protein